MTDGLTQDEAQAIMLQTFEPRFGWAGEDILKFLDRVHEEAGAEPHCGWIQRADIARYVCLCPAGVTVLTAAANVAGNAWRN